MNHSTGNKPLQFRTTGSFPRVNALVDRWHKSAGLTPNSGLESAYIQRHLARFDHYGHLLLGELTKKLAPYQREYLTLLPEYRTLQKVAATTINNADYEDSTQGRRTLRSALSEVSNARAECKVLAAHLAELFHRMETLFVTYRLQFAAAADQLRTLFCIYCGGVLRRNVSVSAFEIPNITAIRFHHGIDTLEEKILKEWKGADPNAQKQEARPDSASEEAFPEAD